MRKSKNIFNNNISPQNLMEQQGYRQFRIGNRNITSNWLVGVQRNQYLKYILSTLYLSQLQKQLFQLKQSDTNLMKQSNLFKIGNLKKKINNFALVQQSKQKTVSQPALVNNQPPDTSNLIFQKQIGFFKSLVERKCKIQNKELLIESSKDANSPYLKIDIQSYSIELESKDRPLNKIEFRQYYWCKNYQYRILLYGANMKQYAIYGNIQELQKLQRFFQVQTIQVKKLAVFTKLDSQFQQKVITLFGNKVRFFDHNLKIRRAQRQLHNDKIKINQSIQVKRQDTAKFVQPSISSQYEKSQKNKSSDLGASGRFQKSTFELLANIKPVKTAQILQQALNTQFKKQNQQSFFFRRPKSKEKKDAQIFKLKINRSVVFYDELQDGFNFEDLKKGDKQQIKDFQLNLKDQIGISDDELSNKNSSIRNSLNISSKSNKVSSINKTNSAKKKVLHMELRNNMNESEKYNINIYEVDSNYSSENHKRNSRDRGLSEMMRQQDYIQNDDEESQKISQKSLKSLSLSHIPDPWNQKDYKSIQRSNTADILQIVNQMEYSAEQKQFFNLRQSRPDFQNKQKFLIKNQVPKRKKQIEIVQNIKPATIYYAIQQIQMFIPYYKQYIDFQILQIDLNLQIQNKLVVIGRTKGQLRQVSTKDKEKYIFYSVQGGHHFKFSQLSDQFIFVLQEQTKSIYLKYSIDPKPKYQRNCSQILIKQIDKDTTLAFSLGLFSSPEEINLHPPLTTIQFMLKYLNNGQDYNFKKDFIDDKKRRFLVKRQWNKKILESILKNGDFDRFSKAIFLGMTQPLFKKMKKNLEYNSQRLFQFNQRQFRMLQQNIFSVGGMDLRSFMKPANLIKHITETLYNECFKQRLQQLYVFFLSRYGSTRNYALIFIKEVISKIESVIVYGRKQKDVFDIVDLYFEVQYEIDQLFLQIGKYFQKEQKQEVSK